ncbi:acyltransferase family protein [Lonepinella sp. BR2474]|uniref:acyltransferase family protein n=1 Tax=Lonepinella sp. BR2474 TaxID=3434548 RepID=UPI003F6DD8AD
MTEIIILRQWLHNGYTGVSLFIFLTGFLFCIISDYGNKKINYKGFVYNRILRIFPMMILMVFIVITLSRKDSTPMDIFRILTLQLNTGQSYTGWGHDFYPTGPIWTIAVEFQFYLLFPFFALFLSKYGLRYLIAVVILIMGIRYNVALIRPTSYYNFYHTILGRLDQFVLGMIFAVLYKRKYFEFLSSKLVSLFVVLSALCLLLFMFTHFTNKNIPIFISLSFTIEGILWGMVVVSYLKVRLPEINWINVGLAKLGEISFSLYLLHLPISDMLNKLFGLKGATTLGESLMMSSLKLIPIILISFLTFYVIEKPFMSLRVRYTSEKT